MGRKKSKRFLPYHEAKSYVQRNSNATSRRTYWDWWDRVRPEFLPRYPYRVYLDEWDSWNDWFGNTNSFEKMKNRSRKPTYRPYWEAVRYAQAAAKEYNLKTKDDWEEWYDSGMCDKDIPKRPYHEYEEFTGRGWKVWLGLDIQAKIDTHKENVGVLMLCQAAGMQPNVIIVEIEKDGLAALKASYNPQYHGKVIRLYRWDPDMFKYADRVLRKFASEGEGTYWTVANLYDLTYELDQLFDVIKV